MVIDIQITSIIFLHENRNRLDGIITCGPTLKAMTIKRNFEMFCDLKVQCRSPGFFKCISPLTSASYCYEVKLGNANGFEVLIIFTSPRKWNKSCKMYAFF